MIDEETYLSRLGLSLRRSEKTKSASYLTNLIGKIEEKKKKNFNSFRKKSPVASSALTTETSHSKRYWYFGRKWVSYVLEDKEKRDFISACDEVTQNTSVNSEIILKLNFFFRCDPHQTIQMTWNRFSVHSKSSF